MAEIDKMLIKLLQGILIGGFFIVVLFMYFKHDSDINKPNPSTDSLRIVKQLYKDCSDNNKKMQGMLLDSNLHRNCIRVWDK